MKGALEDNAAIGMRAAGLALAGLGLFTMDTGSSAPTHTLVLPLVMALGAALALRNVLAVALAVIALAGIRARIGDPDWVIGIAYPLLTATAAVVVIVLLARRFRARVLATRDARHARRSSGTL